MKWAFISKFGFNSINRPVYSTYNVWTDTLKTISEIKKPLEKNTKYKLTKTVKEEIVKVRDSYQISKGHILLIND